jgi:TP901 family phage tail tape measure protein
MNNGTFLGSVYATLELNTGAFTAGIASAKAEAAGLGSSVKAASAEISTAGASMATAGGAGNTLSKELNAAAGAAGVAGSEIEKTTTKTKSFGENMAGAGAGIKNAGQALLPFAVAAGAAVALSVKASNQFNQSMELITTSAGASQKEVDSLKDKVLALAPAVGFGPDKLAEALYHVESVGYRGSQAMDILRMAAEGAQIGQADLDHTTYALTSTLSSQVMGAESAAKAMGTLNAIVGAGDMHMEDLNGAIGTGFLNSAKVFGLSLTATGAALATLTDNGEHADSAATHLRMSMSLMAAPSKAAAKAFEGIGLSTLSLSEDLRKPNGFLVAVQDIKAHLATTFGPESVNQLASYSKILKEQGAGAADAYAASAGGAANALSKMFGGGKSDAAILTLLGNTDRLDSKFKQITETSNSFAESWAKQQKTSKQAYMDFTAQLDVLKVKFGNAIMPVVLELAKAFGHLFDIIGNIPKPILMVVGGISILLAIIVPLMLIVGSVIEAFTVIAGVVEAAGIAIASAGGIIAFLGGVLGSIVGFLTSPVVLIAALAAAIVYLGAKFGWWKDILNDIKPVIHDLGEYISIMFAAITGADPTVGVSPKYRAFSQAMSAVQIVSLDLQDAFKELVQIFESVYKAVEPIVAVVGKELLKAFQDVWKSITSAIMPAFHSIVSALKPIEPYLKYIAIALGLLVAAPLIIGIALIVAGFYAVAKVIQFLAPVLGFMIKLFASIISILIRVAEYIVGAVVGAFLLIVKISETVTLAIMAMGKWFASVFNAILSVVTTIFNTVLSVITTVLNAIWSVVGFVLALILAVYIWIFKQIYNAVIDPITAVWNFIVRIWNSVYDFISGVLQNVWNRITSVWNSVYNFMAGLLQGIWNTVSSIWNSIYNAISGAVQSVWNRLTSVFNSVASFVSGIWNTIYNYIASAINNAVNVVGGLAGRVIGAVSGAVNWLYDAGKNIVQGLINGIEHMGGSLASSVTNFVKANVPGPILKVLGIHSPSTLMQQYGMYTAQGLALGIENNAGLVGMAARNMANQIAGNVTMGVSGMAANSASAGQTPAGGSSQNGSAGTVNVYGGVTVDGKSSQGNKLMDILARSQVMADKGVVTA